MFWWASPAWIENLFHSSPSFLSAAALMFVYKFLNFPVHASVPSKIFILVFLACVSNGFYTIASPVSGAQVNGFLNIIVAILSLSACIQRYLSGEKYALLLLIAVSAPILATLIYYAGNFGLGTRVPDDIFAPAFSLEMLLMSVSLSQRVSKLRRQKLKIEENQSEILSNTKAKAINDLAASISHEVNNPLMIIYGGITVK